LRHDTQEFHHNSVTIDTFEHTKADWKRRPSRQLTLTDENDNEILALQMFLSSVLDQALRSQERAGKYLVMRIDNGKLTEVQARELLKIVSSDDRAKQLLLALESVNNSPEALWTLATTASSEPRLAGLTAAALNVAKFTHAHGELKRLIEVNAAEYEFQRHLADNPWLFGSEYSALLDRSRWTRDEQQDFMLRRTVDGYLEVIEIKTPLNGTPLLRFDQSHGSYYAVSDLSRVQGQVTKYLQRLDDQRLSIAVTDEERILKARAKIIIGRNGDQQQVEALRQYNSHLHRIEILTFDQLLQIGERVLEHLYQVIEPAQS